MKKIIFVFLLFTKVVLGQNLNNKIVYLDSTYTECSQENFKFYRIIKDYYLDQKFYQFTQYYDSDKLESEGISTNKDFFVGKGEATSYFENGTKKSIINYDDGHKSGKCVYWYENGVKKLEGEYILTEDEKKNIVSILKINNYWDDENNPKVVDGNGFYTDEESKEKSKKPVITSSGAILNGFKEGNWIGSDRMNKFTFEETYKEGILISGVSTDENGEKHHYTIMNVKPEPKDGMNSFYSFIAKNFNQPENLKVGGKIITSFIVDKEGKITSLKTVKSLQPDADAEAIRVLKKFDGFTPCMSRGIKINCYYRIPITIQGY